MSQLKGNYYVTEVGCSRNEICGVETYILRPGQLNHEWRVSTSLQPFSYGLLANSNNQDAECERRHDPYTRNLVTKLISQVCLTCDSSHSLRHGPHGALSPARARLETHQAPPSSRSAAYIDGLDIPPKRKECTGHMKSIIALHIRTFPVPRTR